MNVTERHLGRSGIQSAYSKAPSSRMEPEMRLIAISLMLFSMNAFALKVFFSHEVIMGAKKVCYYSYMGDYVSITVPAASLCPLSIDV